MDKNVNIEKSAFFGNGFQLSIGNHLGIGMNYKVSYDTAIGKNIIIWSEVVLLNSNRQFNKIDIPMCNQGKTISRLIVIGDDVWIETQDIIYPYSY